MKIKIESKKQGAELTSIKVEGKEKLHDGKSYWTRHAPVLFPIVGQIKNNQTKINGKTYEMTQHGFARDMEFEELEKTEKMHKYVLKANEETLKKYPFKFELYISHEIEGNKVTTNYKVINKDTQEMIFGLGGHPAFACDYSTENYEIEFEGKEENIKFMKLENGLLSKEEAKNLIESSNPIDKMEKSKIKLTKDIFKDDAIIMKNIKSTKVKLINAKENKIELEFDFKGFLYLALWSKKGAPFVCIEPWFNTTDKVDTNGEFITKEDILKLKPNEEFNAKYSVKF